MLSNPLAPTHPRFLGTKNKFLAFGNLMDKHPIIASNLFVRRKFKTTEQVLKLAVKIREHLPNPCHPRSIFVGLRRSFAIQLMVSSLHCLAQTRFCRKHHLIRITLYALSLSLCLSLFSRSAYAHPAREIDHQLAQPTLGSNLAQPIDVIVVLDDSGSMATCWPWPSDGQPFRPPCVWPSVNSPSDLSELRYSAARLLVELADDEDRVAVVRFDAQAQGVGVLSSLQPVGPSETRGLLTESLQAPTEYIRRGYTRFDLGLGEAIRLLNTEADPERSRYVLLLTDGEPTQPDGSGSQRIQVAEQVNQLRAAGVLVFPVVLCNPTAGCSGEFLRDQFADFGVREAKTAPDLLRVFSEIFAEMKPDRSVITGRGSVLQLNTRAEQGVRRISFVLPSSEQVRVLRNGEPFLTQRELNDPNVSVTAIDASDVPSGAPAGNWRAETDTAGGFTVIQADSYPQMINPPPSVSNSPASVRYYPAGKQPLIMAQGTGPGAQEDLLYNGQSAMAEFGIGNIKAIIPTDQPRLVSLQLGTEKTALQLVRSFRLEPRSDLPKAQVFSPTASSDGVLESGQASLQVGFGPTSTAQNVSATVFVSDESDDVAAASTSGVIGNGPLVYQARMSCREGVCIDEAFAPEDGRSYAILYLIEGEIDGLRFSDWATAELSLEPAVYLQGLPANIDLAQMPAAGWPIQLSSGTTEEIGRLTAQIEVRRRNDDGSEEVVSGVRLDFSEDVPEEGMLEGFLRVDGMETLRPGQYSGEIILSATNPAGRPMDVKLRPSPVIAVGLDVPRPTARIDRELADFGRVLFDTSPNFRLDREVLLPVEFVGDPFRVTASLQSASCDSVLIVPGEMRSQGGRSLLPLSLSSQAVVEPNTCQGILTLAGPNGDYDVFPQQLNWQVSVDRVEWSIVNSELSLGDLRNAGERAQETLLVRFNGKTPFVLQVEKLAASGTLNEGSIQLTEAELEFPPIEITGAPNADGLYEIPIAMVARETIPNDPLRGTFYSGGIELTVVGLPESNRALSFNFRSPTLYQRYVAPIVTPIYSMPWALCSWPLSLLLLIALVARMRGRDFEEDEWEEAAVASMSQAQREAQQAARVSQPITEPFMDSAPVAAAQSLSNADADAAWSSSSWGDSGFGSGSSGGSSGGSTGTPNDSGWDSNRQASAGGSAYGGSVSDAGDAWSNGW